MKLSYKNPLPDRKLSVIVSFVLNTQKLTLPFSLISDRPPISSKEAVYKKAIIRDIRTTQCRTKQGFTLVELMITVSILAIIVTIAAPAIQTELAKMEAKRVYNLIDSTLALAKAESYTRRQDVLVCLSDAGGYCDRDGNKTLLLFIDKNSNNHFDATADLLITEQSLNLKYSTLNLRVGSRRHYTKFWGDSGTPRGHFGHIKYCPTVTYNKAMYLVSFNQSGIVKQKLNEDHPTDCNDT